MSSSSIPIRDRSQPSSDRRPSSRASSHQAPPSREGSHPPPTSRQSSRPWPTSRSSSRPATTAPASSDQPSSGQAAPAVRRALDDVLPAELLGSVASFLERRDLANLCLASQRLGAAATEELYRTLVVDLSTFPSTGGFFQSNNRGHRYIQGLIVQAYTSDLMEEQTWQTAVTLLKRILPLVRGDALQCLILPWNLAVDHVVFDTLRKEQKKLHHLAIGPLIGVGTLRLRYALEMGWLKTLKSLKVPERMGSVHELTFYGQVIRDSKRLKTLEISTFSMFRGFESSQPGGYGYGMVGQFEDDEILERLSQPFDAQENGPHLPIKMDNLVLDHDLRPVEAPLKIVDFSCLQHLTISHCSGAATFLQHLQEVFGVSGHAKQRPRNQLVLRSLRLRTGGEKCASVEGFLQSFAGLQLLLIEQRGHDDDPWEFGLSCLDHHLDTLVHLYIGLGNDFDAVNWEAEQFDEEPRPYGRPKWRANSVDLKPSLQRAQNLQQLALTFPQVYTYEEDVTKVASLREFLDAITELPGLRILRMLSWPRTHTRADNQISWNITRASYHREVECSASNLVCVLRELYTKKGKPPPLKLLIIGNPILLDCPVWDDIRYGPIHDSKTPVCFKTVFPESTGEVAVCFNRRYQPELWSIGHSLTSSKPPPPYAIEVTADEAEAMVPVFDPFAEIGSRGGDRGLGVGGFYPRRWDRDEGYAWDFWY